MGGRINNSNLSYNQRHPILLPARNSYTKMIFRTEHIRLNHAGPQQLLFSLRSKLMMRHNPKLSTQLMGQLPNDRVILQRPFYSTGVDFAGPITTLLLKGRGRKTIKTYIALFICLATKAIHLEAVCDLSTEAFIAALRRFVGRRGCPQTMWSDNGTNFVGARNSFNEMHQLLRNKYSDIHDQFYLPQHMSWKFIPPSAPHMGGLWEAGVKSCKFHLKRIMGNSLFTFEELTTVLVQVEACLHSRPLFQLPSTPHDLLPLTPGHFLVGGPLTFLPDPDVTDISDNRLNRWQLVQKVAQDFWRRWSKEYLTSLQGKTKWLCATPNLEINDVVLIADSVLPPLKWKLGRVIDTHPGSDGRVRVVSLQTANSNCKRPVTKLCKLPTHDPDST